MIFISALALVGSNLISYSSARAESLGLDLGKPTLDEAFVNLSSRFDELRGGFGTAPEFPTSFESLFLSEKMNAYSAWPASHHVLQKS